MKRRRVTGGNGPDGGVLVRNGQDMRSEALPILLARGSEVEELELQGERLRYRLLDGIGPHEGWVTTTFFGRDLLEPLPPRRKPAPKAVGPKGEAPLPVALLFPGQGSQYVGMLQGPAKDLPAVQELLQKAEEVLGWDVLKLCAEGPEELLQETRYCQPAMFVAGLAGLELLRHQDPDKVSRAAVMVGFSLGEYTALYAAGVFSLEDALRLVQLRAEVMHEAANICKQCMLSIVGVPEAKVKQLARDAERKTGKGSQCQIAIKLFDGGFTMGGHESTIMVLKHMAEAAGATSTRVIKTSGAFHTALMAPAKERLAAALTEVLPRMKPPWLSVWMNASAEPLRPTNSCEEIVELMKRQLVKPVLWERTISELIRECRVEEWYEVGPSKQLKAMMKRIDQEAWKKTKNIEV
eukprot:TRINITY_DN62197_c0_g1_i1.p1 TRINITY_DN62197_c0_g1~~TRINITY_DN62197_c0_g1_i1.p1  ORF type:complete len:420 (+),score=101.88 TRINITY_DN62197_c0_g1_i1:36-1262(+)